MYSSRVEVQDAKFLTDTIESNEMPNLRTADTAKRKGQAGQDEKILPKRMHASILEAQARRLRQVSGLRQGFRRCWN
jgi:uncharacterized protein involved in exopolysaccharide biosynthesis